MASRDGPSPPTRGQRTRWICGHCGNPSPAAFDACWNCGTTRDGRPDPGFRPEPDVPIADPPRQQEPPRAGRRLAVTAGTLAVALLMLQLAGPAAVVLTPLCYLYFVLFSPTDRPAGHRVIQIVILLAAGSLATQLSFSMLSH